MLDRIRSLFPRPVRIWLYGVGVAAVPVLIWQDVMEPEAAPLVLGFLLALLNIAPKDPDTP